jgi:hypothetical protein
MRRGLCIWGCGGGSRSGRVVGGEGEGTDDMVSIRR